MNQAATGEVAAALGDVAIGQDFAERIITKEGREQEKAEAQTLVKEKEKEINEALQEHGLTILRDLDKVDKMHEGMHLLSRKIDEAESSIGLSSAKYQEIKKHIADVKRTRERVEDALEEVEKLQSLTDLMYHTEKISTKAMVGIDTALNKKENLTEDNTQQIFLWVRATKQLEARVKHFIDQKFYSKLVNFMENNKEKLATLGSLMAQWWICEATTGIKETVLLNAKKSGENEYIAAAIQESKHFAKANTSLILMGKYVFEETGRKHEFVEYINTARQRELKKLCRLEMVNVETGKMLGDLLRIVAEFLKIDAQIKSFTAQSIDPTVEDYDTQIKARVEAIVNTADTDASKEACLAALKGFLQVADRYELNLVQVQEIHVQTVYHAISKDFQATEATLKSSLKETEELEPKLKKSKALVLSFFQRSKKLAGGVDQVENELDDIILKFTNSLLKSIHAFLSTAKEHPVVVEEFVNSLRAMFFDELSGEWQKQKSTIDRFIDSKLQELVDMHTEQKHNREAPEKAFTQAVDRLVEKIKQPPADSTEVSLYAKDVHETIAMYQNTASKGVLEKKMEETLQAIFQTLPRYKTYTQLSMVEQDFAMIYKYLECNTLDTPSAPILYKTFHKVNQIRKDKKKQLEEPVEDDLLSLWPKASAP
ncbi:hypothetical protein NEDG_01048 [Nematocida displodere]|uniref:Uncharacterized protein n=1 Tax=Nematocida displodere TaxID=1805483 RepID=A0A177ED35_9MICR|nr:hypothetical protein NEDG_01048 [Nematocida displodere]